MPYICIKNKQSSNKKQNKPKKTTLVCYNKQTNMAGLYAHPMFKDLFHLGLKRGVLCLSTAMATSLHNDKN